MKEGNEMKKHQKTTLIEVEHDFGWALNQMKQGNKVARTGWNGKGMYVQLNEVRDFRFSELLPFLTIKNIKNSFNTWVPSISDLLAEDWEIHKSKAKSETSD